MKNLKCLGLFLALTLSNYANAVAVSSLFEVADDDNLGEVKIYNNDGKDMFIRMKMSKIEYIDGEKVITPLNKDNVKDWRLTLTPPQLVLKPNQTKTVKFNYICNESKGEDCRTDEDQIYAIDMSPVPYAEGQTRAVAIAFGYRTYFLIPAKEIDISYEVSRINNEQFKFINNSNTMLTMVFNVCTKEFSSDCIFEYRTLPNSNKVYDLPKEMFDSKNIEGTVINANEEFRENISL
ncbi:pilus assembly protein [Vibrio owensii]|uniref:pilus assembly protein n=1 Tax=Vibrio owensii TaxID=696485 RepID=UPI0040687EA3